MHYQHTSKRRSRPSVGAALGAALGGLALALAAAACAGSPNQSVARVGSAPTTTVVAAPAQGGAVPGSLVTDLARYAACMRKHGVSAFPDPIVSGSAIRMVLPSSIANSPGFKSARAACRAYAPPQLGAPNITPAQQADYLKAAQCMRDHGIQGFPDPTFGGQDGVHFPIPNGMNPNTTQFEAARAVCEKLIPAGLPYSS
ncbi:MAG TPA: hypothetical protein VME46_03800 [Acidimicrobiales bacterium]|nr:hypothetical protein [Acidimicrobiales bacterium]